MYLSIPESLLGLAALFLLTACGVARADTSLKGLARQAASSDPTTADAAISALRARGPAGMQAMLEVHGAVIDRQGRQWALASASPASDEAARVRRALDRVCGQRDCDTSRLFWYTDLEAARAAARLAGKPILSLRLLGRLDDELSCANSRFFRTALYANAEVSSTLRDRFILHWQSVRPVPRITIDFGDGRKIERTITGNSIHYVLDAKGRPIDALPGLYGPKAFLRGIDAAAAVATRAAALDDRTWHRRTADYHQERLNALMTAWQQDLEAVGAPIPASAMPANRAGAMPADLVEAPAPALPAGLIGANARIPSAEEAGVLAATKAAVEIPMVRALAPEGATGRGAIPLPDPATGRGAIPLPDSTIGRGAIPLPDPATLEAITTDDLWPLIAQRHAEDATLDASSRNLMRRKHMTAEQAMRQAMSKARVEDPMLRVFQSFERSIAEDTVRNEYRFHRRMHAWFVEGSAPASIDALNERVYAELFLTPDSDPWLGLVPADTYAALDGAGLTK